jgi:hypothetical protein
MRIIMGLQRRGKNINRSIKDYLVSSITKNNLSLSSKNGIKVKVFDDNNIVNIFPTITSAAKYYGLSNCRLSKYIKLGYSIDNLRFEGEVKYVRVWVYEKKNGVLFVFFQLQIKLLNFLVYIIQFYIVI